MSLSPADLPDPLVTISGPSTGTAGEDLELICGVRVVEHLIAQTIVHVEWSEGANGVEEHVIHNETYTSNTLSMIFNPLLPSHGARYTCQAEINISSINLLKMASDIRNIIVQSKLSNLSLKEINVNSLNLCEQFTHHEHVYIEYASLDKKTPPTMYTLL